MIHPLHSLRSLVNSSPNSNMRLPHCRRQRRLILSNFRERVSTCRVILIAPRQITHQIHIILRRIRIRTIPMPNAGPNLHIRNRSNRSPLPHRVLRRNIRQVTNLNNHVLQIKTSIRVRPQAVNRMHIHKAHTKRSELRRRRHSLHHISQVIQAHRQCTMLHLRTRGTNRSLRLQEPPHFLPAPIVTTIARLQRRSPPFYAGLFACSSTLSSDISSVSSDATSETSATTSISTYTTVSASFDYSSISYFYRSSYI